MPAPMDNELRRKMTNKYLETKHNVEIGKHKRIASTMLHSASRKHSNDQQLGGPVLRENSVMATLNDEPSQQSLRNSIYHI